MIKNLNDLLSVIMLLFMLIISVSLFIWAFVKKEDDNTIDRWELIKDYIDNEEE